MTADFLVDTNILVYLYDRSEAEKQHKAELVVDRLLLSGRGAISTQVMAEFYNAVTRRLKEPLPLELAYLSLQNYQKSWSIVNMTQLSWWMQPVASSITN